jgi:hypothetical protein
MPNQVGSAEGSQIRSQLDDSRSYGRLELGLIRKALR